MSFPVFTKEMRKTHTILVPSMLDIHMPLFEGILKQSGYKVEVMKNEGPRVVEEGLKYVHSDTCYPALLVIGQFIDNLKHRDDTHNVALLITQTGGGCRASNYIYLLRKALIKAGFDYIPILSFNLSTFNKNAGFSLSFKSVLKLVQAIVYGDTLMYLYNKTRSYEKEKNTSLNLTKSWIEKLNNEFALNRGIGYKDMKKNINQIVKDFDNIDVNITNKPKVGVVGEIYIKYASLGNNHLEDLLVSLDAEIQVPGLIGFILYTVYNFEYDYKLYKKNKILQFASKILIKYLRRRETLMINAIKTTKYEPMQYFEHTKDLSEGILDHGTKMGEGWLLTAEMVELIQIGYGNIVCAQPFGCLPNHICGKGVIKKIKQLYPESNIVAIDYDPSATRVNQENRIKLMLAIAKENMTK